MAVLSHKIDFLCIIVAENCNPNGDPLNCNIPRTDFYGYGEMSQECIKRKIRNRLQDMGESIFVQQADRVDDGFCSLKERLQSAFGKKKLDAKELLAACEKWFDVRAFGQVFAFKGDNMSESIRGAVSITPAKTIEPVMIKGYGIIKSTNTVPDDKKDSATFGNRYAIERGVYVFTGGIYPQLAERTGFTEDDAEKIKQAILTLFENDASNSRPNGSMTVGSLYWWEHNCKNGSCPPIKLFRSVEIEPTGGFPYYKINHISENNHVTLSVYNII